ncbi:hypothetical protein [Caulobacter sp. CCG-8]|uniref:hypothetical protein n=1 Tax=Caulobacter sp. CCG-8 TaxID=3127958 RepID=UPI00307DBC75
MSVVERERPEETMPVTSEKMLDIVGYREETPAQAAERDIRDILESFQGDLAKVASTLVCGAFSR